MKLELGVVRYDERLPPQVFFKSSVVEIFLRGGGLFSPGDLWLRLAFTVTSFVILIGLLVPCGSGLSAFRRNLLSRKC